MKLTICVGATGKHIPKGNYIFNILPEISIIKARSIGLSFKWFFWYITFWWTGK